MAISVSAISSGQIVQLSDALGIALATLRQDQEDRDQVHLWDRFLKLPSFKHPGRILSWFLSRTALLHLLERQVPVPDHRGRILASVAHTEGAGAAALLWADWPGEVAGIGIDLEPSTRATSSNLDARIRNTGDPQNWDTLDLWTLKEACHKAGGLGEDTAFADYLIEAPVSVDRVLSVRSPKSCFEAGLLEIEGFRIAVALRLGECA